MTASEPRPGVLDAAFWVWVLGAILLVLFGLLSVTAPAPAFYRGAGVLFTLAGLALGVLSGRTRGGDPRSHRAAVALALVLVVLLAVYALLSAGPIWLLIMVVLMVGTFLAMRPATVAWFDTRGEDD
ncbi:MAG TPA: hypothetical protein VH496_16520 [Mycobacterium sp.]|jgi:hypothetical protein